MKHETHIPTQQAETEENVRVPRPHEDSRRPQGDQAPTPSRTQETGRLTFPKHLRLRKRRDFLSIQKEGRRLVGRRICVDYRISPSGLTRIGITASSRFGNAPERSRFKRLIREVFRKNCLYVPSDLEFNVIPRQKAKGASEEEIRFEFLFLVDSLAKAH